MVGYDGRHHSREFALIVAAVFAARGHRVHLFGDLAPTPLVAFGVPLLGAAAGVMVTASHNPSAYNGIKVAGGARVERGACGTPQLPRVPAR